MQPEHTYLIASYTGLLIHAGSRVGVVWSGTDDLEAWKKKCHEEVRRGEHHRMKQVTHPCLGFGVTTSSTSLQPPRTGYATAPRGSRWEVQAAVNPCRRGRGTTARALLACGRSNGHGAGNAQGRRSKLVNAGQDEAGGGGRHRRWRSGGERKPDPLSFRRMTSVLRT